MPEINIYNNQLLAFGNIIDPVDAVKVFDMQYLVSRMDCVREIGSRRRMKVLRPFLSLHSQTSGGRYSIDPGRTRTLSAIVTLVAGGGK